MPGMREKQTIAGEGTMRTMLEEAQDRHDLGEKS
jgi:hypothetical protein